MPAKLNSVIGPNNGASSAPDNRVSPVIAALMRTIDAGSHSADTVISEDTPSPGTFRRKLQAAR